MITEIFQYTFMVRALATGLLIAGIAPLIGIFLVLRRYSLMADTLSHVALAGVAIGLFFKVPPIAMALIAATVSAVSLERLRSTKRVYGETALSLFLSGSLALAIVLLGLGGGLNSQVFAYLFGSIVTVSVTDLITIGVLSAVVMVGLLWCYRELVFISFDEETARTSGIAVDRLNVWFMALSAVAITLAIPIVGILLVSALMVIPVVAALQLRTSFKKTLLLAEAISVGSTLLGLLLSFYFNIVPGGAIVLTMLAVFGLIGLVAKLLSRVPASQPVVPAP